MYILAIHPDGGFFRVALLEENGKRVKIKFLQEFEKTESDIALLEKKISRETHFKEGEVEVVSALSSSEVFIRHLRLPIRSKKALMKVLPFQIENLLPFSTPPLVFPVWKKGKKETEVSLFCCQKESLKNHLGEIKKLGFASDYVLSIPNALLRFKEIFIKKQGELIFFHFGWEKSALILFSGKTIRQSLTLDFGFKGLIDALKYDYPGSNEIDYSDIEREIDRVLLVPFEKSHFVEMIEQIVSQTRRNLEYLLRKEEGKGEGIIFTGYVPLIRKICRNNKIDYTEIDILPHLEYDKEELLSYAIEIGMAFDVLEKDSFSVQFLQEELTSERKKKEAKRKVKKLVLSAVFASATIFALITSFFMIKADENRERFNHIVLLAGENPTDYRDMQKPFIGVTNYQKAATTLIKKHKGERGEETLLTMPPLVGEVLEVVLSSSSISVNEFIYNLEEFPNLAKPSNSFRIRVCINFTAVFEKDAEELMAKLKGNGHALTKDKNGYQLVFYL